MPLAYLYAVLHFKFLYSHIHNSIGYSINPSIEGYIDLFPRVARNLILNIVEYYILNRHCFPP